MQKGKGKPKGMRGDVWGLPFEFAAKDDMQERYPA